MGTTMTAVVVAGGRPAARRPCRRLARVPPARRHAPRSSPTTTASSGAGPRRPAHARAGRVASAARDRDARARRRRTTSTSTCTPSTSSPGDRLVICSDGLTDMVRDRDVERIARGESDPQRAAELLVDAANDGGRRSTTSRSSCSTSTKSTRTAPPDPEALVVDDAPRPTPVLDPARPTSPAPPPPEAAAPPLRRRIRGALLAARSRCS